MNGSLRNLFALAAFVLASFRFTVPCYTVLTIPSKDETAVSLAVMFVCLSTDVILLYQFLSRWYLAKSTSFFYVVLALLLFAC